MRRLLILVAFCAAAVQNTSAQGRTVNVSGYVRDAATGEVLTGATIVKDIAHYDVANQLGYYSIKLPEGVHTLTCSFLGYDSRQVTVKSDTIVNFALSSSRTMLETVVVKASARPAEVRGLGTIGINTGQLKYLPLFFGERDVIKFMQMLPGISSGREGSSQLNVRGGSGDQTLMLLDNVPVFNQNHAFGVVSIFNGDALSGGELYKGYIPTEYGGRLSSVAALTMRDGNKYEHHQSLTVGTLTVALMAEGPLKKGKGSYLVSARQFIPGMLLRGLWAVRNDDLRIVYSFHDITAKVNYQLGKRNTIFGGFYTGRDYFSIDDTDRAFDSAQGKSVRISENGAGYDWGNITGSLRLNTILGTKAFMNNSVYFSKLSNHQNLYFKDLQSASKMNSDVSSSLYEMGWRWVVEQNIGSAHKFKYGLNASAQRFSPQNTSYTREGETTSRHFDEKNLYTGALFAEDRIKIGMFKIDLGARLSIYHNDRRPVVAFEPRVGLTAQLNDRNSAWLSLTRSTQPLFSVTKMNNGLPFDYWLPYADNKVESADQVSAGWKTSDVKNLILTIEGFYKRMNNLSLIYSVDDYLLGEADLQPADGYAYGVELMAQYTLNRLSITGSYTFSRSMRRADGVTFPYIYDTPHNLNVFASYNTLERSDRRHTLSLNAGYRTGLPYSVAVATYPGVELPFPIGVENPDIYDTPRYPNTRMPDYFRADLSFIMERQKRTGVRTWQFSILNLTNRHNPIMIYPSKRSPTGSVPQTLSLSCLRFLIKEPSKNLST